MSSVSEALPTPAARDLASPRGEGMREFFRYLRRNPSLMYGLGLLFALLAFIVIGHFTVDQIQYRPLSVRPLQPPSRDLPFGSDKQGRNLYAVMVEGTPLTLRIGYVSGQAEDGYEPALVLVKAATQWREDASGLRLQREHLRHLVPAGRLDIDSTGLLVLTQDGRIAKQLIGETSEVEKEYLVRVQSTSGERLSDQGLRLLNHGLELDGEALQPARVEWVNDDQLRFVLVEGKKRQIRRMCEAVGLKVTGLKRVRIGRVMLGDLPAGQWRYLGADESFA